jgi:hypothetical protein
VKGYQQTYGSLSFVSVVGAGHMGNQIYYFLICFFIVCKICSVVPHDQPANALEMVMSFVNNQQLPNPPARK